MKKITNNRTFVIICLAVLIYCLSLLIEKRIAPNTGADFKLWSPYFLVFAVFIPLVILLPIRFLPSSRYTNFILQRIKMFKRTIVISTGIILIWLLSWYAMGAVGDLMGKSLNTKEAETASLTSIKNDSTIKTKIGSVDSIELVSCSISSTVATYEYFLYGKDAKINVEVSLIHEQQWFADTIIIN